MNHIIYKKYSQFSLLASIFFLLFLILVSCESEDQDTDELEIDPKILSIIPSEGVEGDTITIHLDKKITDLNTIGVFFNDLTAELIERGDNFIRIQIPAGSLTSEPVVAIDLLEFQTQEWYKSDANFKFKPLIITKYPKNLQVRELDSLLIIEGSGFSKFKALYTLKLKMESGFQTFALHQSNQGSLTFKVKNFQYAYQNLDQELLYQDQLIEANENKLIFVDFFRFPTNTFNQDFVPTSLIYLEFPYSFPLYSTSELLIDNKKANILYTINGDDGNIWVAEIPQTSTGSKTIEIKHNNILLQNEIKTINIVEGSFNLSSDEINSGAKVTIAVSHYVQKYSFIVRLLNPQNDALIEEKVVTAQGNPNAKGMIGDFYPSSGAGFYKIQVILKDNAGNISYHLPPNKFYPTLPFAAIKIN